MAQNIQSLWPPDIKATVMSPSTILKGQAEALALQTGGVLLAEILEEQSEEEGNIILFLDLVAPALHASRHRILKVTHREDMPYPAWVQAETFQKNVGSSRRADTDEEFTADIAEVLRSPHVLSVAQSLVARANEALTNKQNGSAQ